MAEMPTIERDLPLEALGAVEPGSKGCEIGATMEMCGLWRGARLVGSSPGSVSSPSSLGKGKGFFKGDMFWMLLAEE